MNALGIAAVATVIKLSVKKLFLLFMEVLKKKKIARHFPPSLQRVSRRKCPSPPPRHARSREDTPARSIFLDVFAGRDRARPFRSGCGREERSWQLLASL